MRNAEINRAIKRATVLAAILLTGGCASSQGDYPSLALRDNERVSGTFAAPAPSPFVPAPASPATLESLDELTAAATVAHEAFLAAVGTARPAVKRASGSAVGSDAWAEAQVAVAGLESRRSLATIALADIDRLYVDAVTQGGETAQIEDSRRVVTAQVSEQDAQIAALLARLAP